MFLILKNLFHNFQYHKKFLIKIYQNHIILIIIIIFKILFNLLYYYLNNHKLQLL